MIKFENINFLYLLLLLIPLAAIFVFFLFWQHRAIRRIGQLNLVTRLMPEKPRFKHQVKFILMMLAFASICIGLANPQIGTKYEKVKRQGIDVIVGLDVSTSMLAEDVKPNRLERAKLLVSKLIDKMQNDRIGLIVFAGNAYLQMPLTIDHAASKLFLNTVNTSMVPTQGTAISDAIRLAIEAFGQDEKKYKALIIITDGEDNEGDALAAVDEATAEGIVIHTIGVGSPQGTPIPLYKNGVQIDFKRDASNNIVLSKLNETILQQIAVKGNGNYQRLSSGTEELNQLFSAISSMEKKEIEERVFTDYEDQFQYFIAFALVLLTLEFFISERKSAWLGGWKLFQPAER
ncbi:MAG TPA: VWA domain-containing protein [Chitinophagales bacterium]|nr:VWA domain-containing protein [Chitinophagales bacterium]